MAQRTKSAYNWRKIVLEASMIVLSVLLALFINEWKRDYNEQQETAKMLRNIKEEIASNEQFVEALIPYHAGILENIQVAAMTDSLEATFLTDGYFDFHAVAPKGLKQGDLHDIAWIVAKEERISNRITFEVAQLLFSVYDQQTRVLETIDRIIGILSARAIHRKELIEESVIVLAIELNELISQEQQLNTLYTEALETLNSEAD